MIGNGLVDITYLIYGGMRRFTMRSRGIKTGYKRMLALLLCMALCVENGAFSVLAAEPVPGSVSENALESALEPVPGNALEPEVETISENALETPSAGMEEDRETEENISSGNAQDTLPEKVEEDGERAGEETGPEQLQESAESEESREEPESVSENTVETISENTPDVKETGDREWEETAREACEAFRSLASEKNLMALLYRTDSYAVHSEAAADSGVTDTLEIGQTLYIKGVEINQDGVWYLAQYLTGGTESTGYVESGYLAYADEDWTAWEEKYLRPYSVTPYAEENSDVSAFPKSYQSALTKLKNAHPNWLFVPMRTGLDFQTAVSKEMGEKSLIQKTSNNSSSGWVGDACPSESGWYYATRPAVAYHLDPRNFLTEAYIFQFEQLTFNGSYHTESAVQTFLDGTFMKGTLPDDSAKRTYAKAFYEIGSGRKLSPIHLASRVYQEQGKGTSGLISGTYPGYEGYYNFFNVGVNGASTAEKIVKGLTYAKEKGWDSRYKSLEGGAATIGNNYILKYQDTIYLEKFNVDKNSPYGVYNHQYMQNIQAPASEASSTRKMYAGAGSLNSAFVFKIPVYDDMPQEGGDEPEVPDIPDVPEKPVVTACTLIFHNQDGQSDTSVIERRILDCGEKVGALPQAQMLEDRVFCGWYTETNGRGNRISADTVVYEETTHVYPYYQKIESGFYVAPVGEQVYTGSAIKPQVQVFDGTLMAGGVLASEKERIVKALAEGKDYTVSYKNNKNVNGEGAARPAIIVKGRGNYEGTQEIYFDILPKALSDSDITAENITVAYSGKIVKRTPVLYRGAKKLTVNKDYTVQYPAAGADAYRAVGAYPVTITGKGGYTGEITVYETITTEILLSKVKVAKIPSQTYTSGQMAADGGIKPEALQVTYQKNTLTEGVDYTVAYSANRRVGTATATLTAVKGSGYAGKKKVTYKIVGVSIAKAKVSGLTNKEYVEIDKTFHVDSAAYESEYEKMLQSPGTYSLTVDDRVLTQSRDGVNGDYVVSYEGAAKKGAVKAGTAKIVFKGINEYSGTLKKTYKILPCALSEDRVGSSRDFTLSYYTQDAPENVKKLTDLNGITAPYVKGGSKPVILLSFCGEELTQGKDYTVSYKNNNALTTADTDSGKQPVFIVKGKGNFKGTVTGSFAVTDGLFDKKMGGGQDERRKVTIALKDVAYLEKKGAYKTKAVLRDVNGAALKAGLDYDKNLQYTYEADTEVLQLREEELVQIRRKKGEAVDGEDIPPKGASIRVTAKGIGLYAGGGETPPEISAVYRIVANDFRKAKVTAASKRYQDGRPVTLTAADLSVTVSGVAEPLEYGTDYVIVQDSYVNHTKKGKAKVTLKGIGNYGGEKTVTYKIGAKLLQW